MNIWIKSIVAGIVSTGLLFILYTSGLFGQKTRPFSNEGQLYKAHYRVRVSAGDKTGGSGTDMQNICAIIQKRLSGAGYSCSIKTNSGEILDITAGNIDDTSFLPLLITGNRDVGFREVYTLGEMLALREADKIIGKYLPPAEIKRTAPLKPAGTGDSLHYPLKALEPAEEYVNNIPGSIVSLIHFIEPSRDESGRIQYSPSLGLVRVADSAVVNRILQDPVLLQALPHDVRFYYGPVMIENKEKMLSLYAIRTRNSQPELQNADIQQASASFRNERPEVMLQFKPAGSRKWARLTAANIGRPLAIIFDGVVVSAPTVIDVIEGGSAMISGGFTVGEVRLLAAQLSGNRIPAVLTIASHEITPQNNGTRIKYVLFIVIVFAIMTGLAFFIFNTLKNR